MIKTLTVLSAGTVLVNAFVNADTTGAQYFIGLLIAIVLWVA